ncbi:metallo-hydrolase oxidoreductase [Fusarium subglutinans]|uniref:Metallo-hydrolase oxidoreductase n=1 Tax=Gibberella subglutinans TaxID=42677 RepID=A0A8H5LBS4_GIBSU|nr:metallo-hydrolase oxidoreductase [Fusarium subglutinans]KAF5587801.1 metallo-hydrolase oxidoreductase [Fusarium subglutinans]
MFRVLMFRLNRKGKQPLGDSITYVFVKHPSDIGEQKTTFGHDLCPYRTPEDGLLLYETGAGKDYTEVWGPQVADIFARGEYSEDLELDAAIKKIAHDIKDVKGVIMGHLHLDHAGGLEYFRGTDVPIYVHEIELKNAFYSAATKVDIGVYLPTYLQFDLNWTPLYGDSILNA